MFSGVKSVKLTKILRKSNFHKNVRCSNRDLTEDEKNQVKQELSEQFKVSKESFEAIIGNKPHTPEEIYTPVTETVIQGYDEVYNLFNKPLERDYLPAKYYELTSDEDRSAFLAHLRAYQEARNPLGAKHGFALAAAEFRMNAVRERANIKMKDTPIRVAVSGAAGQLGYALVFRIASGGLFGPNQPVILQLLERPEAINALDGVVMELLDCAFPTLSKVVATSNAEVAFQGADYALLVGAFPRGPGMERGDLLKKNAEIFSSQGKALNSAANGSGTRVIVVGNPANTNAMIASHHAPNIPPTNFSALTRLDHNRGLTQLASKANCSVSDIDRFVIWGNHSSTMVPDITHAYINGKLATDVITDKEWLQKTFVPAVQKRGAAIIAARKVSSAASAANAVVEAAASWHFGTHAKWTSAAHISNGEYGVTPGLFYSYPVVYNENGEFDIVRNLPIDQATADAMEATHKELLEERDAVKDLLSNLS